MTVRVRRTFEFEAPPERIWSFISDPAKRAEAISVVEDFDIGEDGQATWQVSLPIPLLNTTATVHTQDVERTPARHVTFTGRSRVMRVTSEHTIEETDDGSRLINEFVVEGRIPGVEQYFRRNLDRELENLEAALRRELEVTA